MNQTKIEPFSLSALERIAKIIGGRYSGSEITTFFRKAGFSQICHDGTTKWRFVYAALEQIQSNSYGHNSSSNKKVSYFLICYFLFISFSYSNALIGYIALLIICTGFHNTSSLYLDMLKN